jgi:DNA-binding transcriptional LysR family regulator
MALRLGHPPDSGFGARLLASAPRLVIAAPAYLAQRGAPETLADLSQHDCIVGPGLSGRSGWSFTRAGAVTSVVVEGRIQVASAEGVMACVRAALGIVCADVSRVRPVSTPLPTTSLAPVPQASRSSASVSFRQRRGSRNRASTISR